MRFFWQQLWIVSCLKGWLCFAIEHDVCHLDLDVYLRWVKRVRYLRLPQSILTCKTLTKLIMHKDFALAILDSMACFPSLKISSYYGFISKSWVKCKNCFAIVLLLTICQLREILKMFIVELTFKIIVPTLSRLRISLSSSRTRSGHVSHHKFVISASNNLEYLSIKDDSLGCFVLWWMKHPF